MTDWVKTSSLTPDEILRNFRLSFVPRIAVTVDMISTGTDVKPIECVFFVRNVASAGFFEQMKGRGVRVISPDKLRAVTPSARVKDRFIVVDAVGVCERDKTDSRPLNRQPSRTLAQVLSHVARGGISPDALTTLAARLARLQRRFSPAQLEELKKLAGGKSIPDLARGLLHACDPDVQTEAAREQFGVVRPLKKQIDQAAKQIARDAVTPYLKPAFRRRILELHRQTEQTIDRHTIDDVLYSGFDASAVEKARAKVQDFRAWIEQLRSELTALQAILRWSAATQAFPPGPPRIEGGARPPAARGHSGSALARLRGGGAGQGQGRPRNVGGRGAARRSREPRSRGAHPGLQPRALPGGDAGALPDVAGGTRRRQRVHGGAAGMA